jgi:hypothetical protein
MVIGVPGEKWGEMLLAVVVKAPGKEVSESELPGPSRMRPWGTIFQTGTRRY